VFVSREGTRVSTLDLFGRSFVLLAGSDGEPWHVAARAAAAELRVPLDGYVIGAGELGDTEGGFPDAYGISESGAALVRPDGIVGWRARDATGASEQSMRSTLASLLCRNDLTGR
jgi:putative polyketide hydroxylase